MAPSNCIAVESLTADDFVICMPQEVAGRAENNVPTHHTLAICGTRGDASYEAVAGHPQLVRSGRGLPKLCISLSDVDVLRPRVFEKSTDGSLAHTEDRNRDPTMGIILSEDVHRVALRNMEQLIQRMRRVLLLNADVRSTLRISGNVTESNVDVFAESLDGISILKKAADRAEEGSVQKQQQQQQQATMWAWPRVVTSGWYRTAFFLPNGQELPLSVVKQWGGRIQAPKLVLSVDSIFASRICKSLRLRVVEAMVIAPTERPQSRHSMLFPEMVIGGEEPTGAPAETNPGTPPPPPPAVNEVSPPEPEPSAPVPEPEPEQQPCTPPAQPIGQAMQNTPPRKRKRGGATADAEVVGNKKAARAGEDAGECPVQQQLLFEDTQAAC